MFGGKIVSLASSLGSAINMMWFGGEQRARDRREKITQEAIKTSNEKLGAPEALQFQKEIRLRQAKELDHLTDADKDIMDLESKQVDAKIDQLRLLQEQNKKQVEINKQLEKQFQQTGFVEGLKKGTKDTLTQIKQNRQTTYTLAALGTDNLMSSDGETPNQRVLADLKQYFAANKATLELSRAEGGLGKLPFENIKNILDKEVTDIVIEDIDQLAYEFKLINENSKIYAEEFDAKVEEIVKQNFEGKLQQYSNAITEQQKKVKGIMVNHVGTEDNPYKEKLDKNSTYADFEQAYNFEVNKIQDLIKISEEGLKKESRKKKPNEGTIELWKQSIEKNTKYLEELNTEMAQLKGSYEDLDTETDKVTMAAREQVDMLNNAAIDSANASGVVVAQRERELKGEIHQNIDDIVPKAEDLNKRNIDASKLKDTFAGLGKATVSFAGGLTALNGALEVWGQVAEGDVTTGQALASTIMSLTFALPMMISGIKALDGALKTVTATATTAHIATAGITLAITATYMAITAYQRQQQKEIERHNEAVQKSLKHLSEQTKKVSEEVSNTKTALEQTSALESLNIQLQNLNLTREEYNDAILNTANNLEIEHADVYAAAGAYNLLAQKIREVEDAERERANAQSTTVHSLAASTIAQSANINVNGSDLVRLRKGILNFTAADYAGGEYLGNNATRELTEILNTSDFSNINLNNLTNQQLYDFLNLMIEASTDVEKYGEAFSSTALELVGGIENINEVMSLLGETIENDLTIKIQDFLNQNVNTLSSTTNYSKLYGQFNKALGEAAETFEEDEDYEKARKAIEDRFVDINGEIGTNLLMLVQAAEDYGFDLDAFFDLTSEKQNAAIELLKKNYSVFGALMITAGEDFDLTIENIQKALDAVDATNFVGNINDIINAISGFKYGDTKTRDEWITALNKDVGLYEDMVAAGDIIETGTESVFVRDPSKYIQEVQDRYWSMTPSEANAYYDSLIDQEMQAREAEVLNLRETGSSSLDQVIADLGIENFNASQFYKRIGATSLDFNELINSNIYDLPTKLKIEGGLSQEQVDMIYELLEEVETETNDTTKLIDENILSLEDQKSSYEQFAFTAETSLADIKSQWAKYGTAVNLQEKNVRVALIRSAVEYGMDAAAVEQYSDYLQENTEELQNNAIMADYVAVAQYRLETGLKDLNSNFDDYNKVLTTSTKGSAEYAEALNKVETDLQHIFNTDENIDETFITTHLKDIEKAAKGDIEAISDLQIAYAELTILSDDKLKADLEGFKQELDTVQWGDIEIGADVTTDDMLNKWFNSMNEMVKAGNMSAQQMQAIWNSLGFELEPIYKKVLIALGSTESTNYIPSEVLANTSMGTKLVEQEVFAGFSAKNTSYTGTGQAAKSVKNSAKGGGGGKSSQKDHKEEEERYYTITRRIKDQEDELDRLGKAKDRAYGKAHSDLINQEASALDREIELQKEYLKEIEDYYQSDRAKIAGFGAQFDENGVITNYEQLLKQELDAYNAAVDQFNKDGDEAAFAIAEKRYNDFLAYGKQYDETLQLWEQEQDKLTDKINARYDKTLEDIEYKITIDIEIDDSQLKVLEYQLKHLQNMSFSTADQINNKVQQLNLNIDKGNIAKSGVEALLGSKGLTLKSILTLSDDQIANLGFTADEVGKIRDYLNDMMSSGETVETLAREIASGPLQAFKEWNEEFDRQEQKIEHNTKLIQHYKNIADLTRTNAAGIDDNFITSFLEGQLDTQISGVAAARAELEANQKELADIRAQWIAETDPIMKDQLEKDLKEVEQMVQTSEENLLSMTEAALQQAQALLTDALDKAKKQFQQATFTDDWSMTQFDRLKELDDQYLDDYEKIYEFSKLTRDVNNSINSAQAIRDKERLREVTEEIAELENSNAQVSQYQVDALRAKYELRLAEIALEDAQNAKSTVRMQRDNEGNWSYVYTADNNKVDEARQKYEDKLYEYQKLNSNFIKEQQSNFNKMEQQYVEEMYKIANDATLTEDEKEQRMRETQEYYQQLAQIMSDQLGIALDKNSALYRDDWTWFNKYTGYKISDIDDFITEMKDTYLGELDPTLTEADGIYDRFAEACEGYFGRITTALGNYKTRQDEILSESGLGGLTNLADTLKGKMGEATKAADDAEKQVATDTGKMVTDIGNVIAELQKLNGISINGFVQAMGQAAGAVTDLVNEYARLNQATGTTPTLPPPGPANTYINAPYNPGAGGGSGSSGGENRRTGIDLSKLSSASSLYAYFMALGYSTDKNGLGPDEAKWYMAAIEQARDEVARDVIFQEWKKKYGKYWGEISRETKGRIKEYDTGGYTGSWGTSGRLAFLHQKELVLNAQDTENMLKMTEYVRDLAQMVDLRAAADSMARVDSMGSAMTAAQAIEQNVRIEASFPNVTSSSEIEEAFNNLVNRAAQYASRTKY